MAFRDVRTAAALTGFLLLFAGCQQGDGNGERMTRAQMSAAPTLPDDSVALPPGQLARLPWYGAQGLDCEVVREYLTDTIPTETVQITVKGDRLVIDPDTIVAPRGGRITWEAPESLVWRVEFSERRISGDRPPPLSGDRTTSVIPDEPSSCGRDYFFVVAYDTTRNRLYLADPPRWVY